MKKLAESLILVAALAGLVGAASDVIAANRFAVANGPWNQTVPSTIWSTVSGGAAGASVPVAGDVVFIGNTATVRTVTIPAGYAAAATSVTIGNATAVAGGSGLTLSAANASLTTSGNFIINRPSNATTNLLNIGAGTVNVGGSVTLAGTNTTTTRINRISLTAGTLNIAGNLVFITGSAAGNSIVITGAATINLAGAFTATVGTLTPGTTSIFNYNGSVAQTVRRVSNIFYNHLHLNNSNAAGATLSAAVSATNVTGNIRVQSGIFNNGGFAIVGGAGDTFEIANGVRFNLTGTSAMPSAFSTYTLGSTSTTSFQGGNQTIAAVSVTTAVPITYGHVIAQGGGTKTAGAATPPAALNIAGNLSIENATTFTANTSDPIINVTGNMAINGTGIYAASNNAARPLTVSGDFSVAGTYTGNVAPVNLAGNFTRTGTFNSSTGLVTFNGSSLVTPQTLTGATIFTNMAVNNTGLGLSLASDITASTAGAGTLALTNGTVTTGGNFLIVPRPCNIPSVTRTNGFVIGNLRKAIPAGASGCTFEVGSGTSYTPVVLALVAGTGAGNITASTTGVIHPQNAHASSGIDATKSLNRYWTLTNNSVTLPVAGYSATFNYINGTPVDIAAGTPANFIVERWTGAAWASTTLNAGCTATPGTNLCKRVDGLTTAAGFGDFWIGEPKPPPVSPPDSFNAVEVSAAVTGRIFTKLRGANFTLDIVAILLGAQHNTFNEAVTIDLVTGGSGGANCGGGAPTTVAGPTDVTLSGGRVTTGNINVATAYPDVRVRIRYPVGGPYTITTCSSDNFSIKPTAFTITSTDATNTGTGAGATIKTGVNFNLTAAGGAGYVGTPGGNFTGNVVGTPNAGTVGGSFGAAAGGTASGNFFYSEVGNFGLSADAVRDTAFTNTGDQAGSDCVASSTSESLAGGKYGCWVGSAAVAQNTGVSGFGRFIPDNFNVNTTTNPPIFGTGCGTFTYVGTLFTYPGSTGIMTVTARSGTANGLTNTTTQNYAGSYVKLTTATLNQAPYDTKAARYTRFDALSPSPTPALDHTGLPDTATDPTVGAFTNGVGTLTFSAGTGLLFTRDTTTPNAPFNADIALALNVVDSDLVAFAGNPASFGAATAGNGISFSGGKAMRFGRLVIGNASSSAALPLLVPIEAQYWNGKSFITNTLDGCTSVSASGAGSDVAMGTYTGALAPSPNCKTAISNGGALSSGRRSVRLSAPTGNVSGTVTLTVNLGAVASGNTCTSAGALPGTATTANRPYLQGGSGFNQNPSGRATFGVYRGSEDQIHRQENY